MSLSSPKLWPAAIQRVLAAVPYHLRLRVDDACSVACGHNRNVIQAMTGIQLAGGAPR
jgi:hypothetical protein